MLKKPGRGNANSRRPSRWPDYRTVWRWHFYAGLFCIPFVLFLSVTGAIYLFKPQVDAWLDRPYDSLRIAAAAPPSQAVQTALASMPGWTLHDYELPQTPHAAARVVLGHNGREMRVYVDPSAPKVLGAVEEDRRPMNIIFRLHGSLLMGDRGSMLVELAASWAIVMILTGLYLWWPRQATGLGGVLYPRLTAGRKIFWRDLHAVAGIWVSALALFMLVSGLPWAKNWGGYLKEIRHITGTAVAQQDWTTGRSSEIAKRKAMDRAGMGAMSGMPDMSGIHAGHAARSPRAGLSAEALAALDRIAPTVARLNLAPPVLISPPDRPGGLWSARSDAQNRPLRANVTLDPATGAVVHFQGFDQRNVIDRIVGVSIAAHEGQLFGWPNQMLGIFIAVSLIAVSVSALVLWWRRRAHGALGAPLPLGDPRFSAGLFAIVVMLGVLLPMFGISLVLVALIERSILRRLPGPRHWLGLRGA